MRNPSHSFAPVGALALSLVACSSATKSSVPQDTCGTAPQNAAVVVGLAYPANGSTNVPTSLPQIVVQGSPSDSVAPLTIEVRDAGSAWPPVGTATAAPSPLPSPLERHPRLPATYFALPLKTNLSPNTSYDVYVDTLEWSSTFVDPEAPPCTVPFTASLGVFKTGGAGR